MKRNTLVTLAALALVVACGDGGNSTGPSSVGGVPAGPSLDIAGQAGAPANAHEDLKPGSVATSPAGTLTAGTAVTVTWTAPVSPKNGTQAITVTGYDIKMKCIPATGGSCSVPKGTDNNYVGTSYAMGNLQAGTYTFEIRGIGTTPKTNGNGVDSHGSAYVELQFTVGAAAVVKQDQFITFAVPAGHTSTYGDSHVDISSWATVKTASDADALAAQFRSLSPAVCSVAGSDLAVISAGPCTIEASQPGNDAYNAAVSKTITLQVAQAAQAITFAELADKIYGEDAFELTATGGVSGNPVTFALGENSVGCALSDATDATTNTVTWTVTITGATKEDEACVIVASQLGNGNYLAATPVTRSFAIEKATPTITVTVSGSPFTYDGQTHEATVTVTDADGAVLGSLTPTVTYNGSSARPKDANTYAIAVSLAATDNYKAASATGELVINQATPTIAFTIGAPFTYDGDAHPASAAVEGVAIDGVKEALGSAAITYTGARQGANVQPINADQYTVSASYAGSTNYKPLADVAAVATLVINPVAISVAPDFSPATITYGDATPAFSYTLTSGSFVGNDRAAFAASLSYLLNNAAVPAGLLDKGSYTVEPTWTYENPNYALTPSTRTLTVNARSLTILVDSPAPITYGDATPAFSYSLGSTSFVSASHNVAFDAGLSYVLNDLPVPAGLLDAGTYSIDPKWTYVNPNYTFAITSGSLTVNKAQATVQVVGGEFTWDNQAHPATVSTTPAGLNVDITYNGSRTLVPFAVGSYAVAATVNERNYEGSGTGTVKINAWNLSGFYQPVDMNGVLNTVKNGSTVPLKFNVYAGTTERTDVAAISKFAAVKIGCQSLTEDLIEETVAATGGTVLRYDATGGQFIYNWQTPKAPGVCYKVTMTTLDGSSISALFKLK